jgi:hypothetical protein
MAGTKADKLTVEQRVEAVYRLILDGWTQEQICQNMSKSFRVSDRQVYRYIDAAWQRIEEVAAPERAEHHGRAVAAHYQMLREAKTVKEKATVWAALSGCWGWTRRKLLSWAARTASLFPSEWLIIVLDLPTLRDDQRAIVAHPAKVKVLSMGRRWGKTMMSGCIVMNTLRQHGRAAWIAPTYKNTRPMWRWAVNTAAPVIRSGQMRVNTSDKTITTNYGGELAIYSGDNIDSIRGEAFNVVILDEAAKLSEGAWTDAIMPTLADFDGDAVLISTPRGRNWFYNEFLRAQADGQHGAAWQAPTSDNPMPTIRRAFEMARGRVPEMTFRQEWLAEFVESSGVFRRITEAATAAPHDRGHLNHEYVMGIDWAYSTDFTAVAVLDVTTRSLGVHLDRFNGVDYTMQRERIAAIADRFRPRAIISEANAMGRPNNESLRSHGAGGDKTSRQAGPSKENYHRQSGRRIRAGRHSHPTRPGIDWRITSI